MAAGLKQVRTRIKAIKNIRKITKAMELVSVSKMRRSVVAVLGSRPYAEYCWRILGTLAASGDASTHPLLAQTSEFKRALVIVVSADRGLCGNFNSAVMQKVAQFARRLDGAVELDFVTVGKKAGEAIARRKWSLVASFTNLSIVPTPADIAPIARIAKDGFLARTYDHVFIAYTDFVSTVKQRPVIAQVLPIQEIEGLGAVTELEVKRHANDPSQKNTPPPELIFEPNRKTVLEFLLPRLVETELYQAILESIASEHSARMLAMKNASDAASDIVDDLTLSFNQLRQAGITAEIAEISAGKAVLEV